VGAPKPAQILILGGYGNTGRWLARLLLDHSDAQLVLAGRDGAKAAALAQQLDPKRCQGIALDGADGEALTAALRLLAAQGPALLIVAASVGPQLEISVQSALEAGVCGIDTLLSTAAKHAMLEQLAPAWQTKGLTWLTDGGFHPGLPALLVRHAAARLDAVHSAQVGSVISIDWRPLAFSPSTRRELVDDLLAFDTRALQDGQWRDMGWAKRPFDFASPFGRRDGYAMFLRELEALPKMLPGLSNLGFYVGGFNPLTDNLGLPMAWMLAKLAPQALGGAASRLLLASLRAGSRPPFGTVLRCEVDGLGGGHPTQWLTQLGPTDGYQLTAAPVAAAAFQLLEGGEPGIHCQALWADPDRLMADLARMGIAVTSEAVAAPGATALSAS
jgi:saccharopine dehydrogenase (NAD+, L-lysine-forming)